MSDGVPVFQHGNCNLDIFASSYALAPRDDHSCGAAIDSRYLDCESARISICVLHPGAVGIQVKSVRFVSPWFRVFDDNVLANHSFPIRSPRTIHRRNKQNTRANGNRKPTLQNQFQLRETELKLVPIVPRTETCRNELTSPNTCNIRVPTAAQRLDQLELSFQGTRNREAGVKTSRSSLQAQFPAEAVAEQQVKRVGLRGIGAPPIKRLHRAAARYAV